MSRAFEKLARKLAQSVEGEVRFDAGTVAAYSTDASNYRRVPLGVVMPRHEDDVAATLALARENGMPVLARGGGTSLGGQACNVALVLDFSKYMTRVRVVDAERRLAVVEPGVVPSLLNAQLAKYGLVFAPDPTTADRCTIGGMVGNNACGAHSAAYGKTADNLERLEVLLYDGTRLALGPMDAVELEAAVAAGGRAARLFAALREIGRRYAEPVRRAYPRIPRRVSGYNLDQLLEENGFNPARALVGSEGTLALVLSATLALAPKPASAALIVLGFDDVFSAADQVPWIMEHRPQALEGFDDRLFHFARLRGLPATRLLPAGRAFLLVEIGAENAEALRQKGQELLAEAGKCRQVCGTTALFAPAERLAVWQLRGSGLASSAVVPGYPRTWPGAEDTAVAPERLGAYLRRLSSLVDRHGLWVASYYGHFGQGCVHCRISFDFTSAAGIANFRAFMLALGELVAEFGGSMSGEHGDGLARSEITARILGPQLAAAFAEFKRAFDPQGRMNPGIIVEPDPVDAHLRLTPGPKPPPPLTHFSFEREQGLAGAALKCVGIGKCRKLEGGTMCPSYMATREERHSTRGRARMLYEALSGTLLKRGLADDALYEALELCLSCKACKSECPSGVDMALYKAEFLAYYYRRRLRPLAGHVFGHIHELARLLSAGPRLSGALTSHPIAETVLKRLLGIHPERRLPKPAPVPLRAWLSRRRAAAAGAREVALFPDTFTNFFEPEIGRAAVEVLEHLGFRVTLPQGDFCCGRPLYDQGMLKRARRRLAGCVGALLPFARRGISIVGLEPSCTLTLRDELLAMFPGDRDAALVAEHTFLLGEFVARAPALPAGFALAGRALLHGHCHQKALAGLDDELAALGRVDGLEVEALDAGCCGMAGAFGYDRRRFELSRRIGERLLIPAVDSAAPGTLVIADGFACRAQLRQFCPERVPLHLAQVLRRALVPAV